MCAAAFCCPICGGELAREESSARCLEGHSFDIARQGYLHLLPSNKMHAKAPGDTKEMVAARRRFLQGGYYSLFSKELCRIAAECTKNTPAPVILDAGCGEGYYTGEVKNTLPDSKIFAFDISKPAVKAAAGKYKDISFAVASCFSIPMGDKSCDLLLNVFAPLATEEFARVLKPGGFFIYAVPSERHLYGLKEILYDEPYENTVQDTDYTGFTFLSRQRVRGEIEVPGGQTAQDLFAMTPYYWKTGRQGGERLAKSQGFTTEIGFDFLIYQRT